MGSPTTNWQPCGPTPADPPAVSCSCSYCLPPTPSRTATSQSSSNVPRKTASLPTPNSAISSTSAGKKLPRSSTARRDCSSTRPTWTGGPGSLYRSPARTGTQGAPRPTVSLITTTPPSVTSTSSATTVVSLSSRVLTPLSLTSRLAHVSGLRRSLSLREFVTKPRSSKKSMGSPVLVVTPQDPRTCSRPTPSMLILR